MPAITTESGSSLPPWLEDAFKKLMERAYAVSQEQYIPYPEERQAKFPPDILQAQQLGRQLQTYMPYLQAATQATEQAKKGFPEEYQRYMNPYQQAVLDVMEQRAGRALKEQFLPAIESRYVSAGQHGGKRQQEMSQRAARDVQEALMAEQRQALSSGYGQAAQQHQAEQSRQLAIAEQLSNLGKQEQAGRLGDIATLQEQGLTQQQQEQQKMNQRYQDFLRQRYYPQEQLAQYSATVSGLPSPTHTFSSQYTPPPMQTQLNPLGQIGALAGSLYSGKQAFGFGRKKGGHIKESKSPFSRAKRSFT